MPAILVVKSESEISRLLPWAWAFAESAKLELQVVIAQSRAGETEWTNVELPNSEEKESELPDLLATLQRLARVESENEEADRMIDMDIRRLRDSAPDRVLLEEVRRQSISLLILPLDGKIKESTDSWTGRLYRNVPCETVYLHVPANKPVSCQRILVPTAGKANGTAALKRGDALAKQCEGRTTALFVEPDIDVVSSDVGRRKLNRYIRRAVGSDNSRIEPIALVADDFLEGLQEQLCEPYDIVLVGAYRDRTVRRIFLGSRPSDATGDTSGTVFAAVRAELPFRTRFQQFIERQVQTYVPQLDREQRVSLVDRVHSSSQWDFDFIALICLSTCIAALGLTQNQAPVVIGAMLVAPLMTPLVGAGLALVQGNGSLIRSAVRSVTFGFLLAFLIGILVGLIAMNQGTLPPEILARTSPGLVDLAVAFVGGIAAAYAMSRPNLSSALPGVAIAAALVPPIATAGITLARRELAFTQGACLLFLTNIVAIILGTALSLWMVGIRDTHIHGSKQKWSSRFRTFLLLSVVVIGFMISRKPQTVTESPVDLLTLAMQKAVAESKATDVQIVAISPNVSRTSVEVVVESPTDDLELLAEKLRQSAADFYDAPEMTVKLVVRHVLEARASSSN